MSIINLLFAALICGPIDDFNGLGCAEFEIECEADFVAESDGVIYAHCVGPKFPATLSCRGRLAIEGGELIVRCDRNEPIVRAVTFGSGFES